MGKVISNIKLSETLDLSEQTDGFWLWDETRDMNISMRAKTSTDALVEALGYYQSRLIEVESAYKILQVKVSAFVGQFEEDLD